MDARILQRSRGRPRGKPNLAAFDVPSLVAHLNAAAEAYVPKLRPLTTKEKLTHPDVAFAIAHLVGKGMPVREIRNTLAAGGLRVTETSLRRHLDEILNYPVDDQDNAAAYSDR